MVLKDPSVSSSSGGSGIMYISFRSKKLDSSQVTDYINRVVKPQFFTIEGVAEVQVFGAAEYALRIWLDPQKNGSSKSFCANSDVCPFCK